METLGTLRNDCRQSVCTKQKRRRKDGKYMKLRKKHLALLAALLLLAERGFLNESPVTASAATVPPTVIASPAPTAGNSYTDSTDGGRRQ